LGVSTAVRNRAGRPAVINAFASFAMRTITISHSPDADDAFMFYGFEAGAVRVPGYRFEHELSDIESLNQRALRGELEVTAVSVHALPRIASKYAVLRSGASMGGADYGPKVVTKEKRGVSDLAGRVIGIPGELTSAALATKLFLREQNCDSELVTVPFDQMEQAVLNGEVFAGVIIHESQLTYERSGLSCVCDLGEWWWNREGLPLPLGVNVVRRDLGFDVMRIVGRALKQSIEFSLAHREEALRYALPFGRGIRSADADRFVGMYVNDWTVDLGVRGIESIQRFLKQGADAAGLPPASELVFI
jgi:1,4-dihydroxy-6-naphthoate synthase